MILYRKTKAMVRSTDGDTEFFDVVEGVLQGDTLAPYLFIICLDHVLRISADNHTELGFTISKRKSRRYPAKHITDIDYADDLALLSNSMKDAEKLLHYVEDAASVIGLHINAKKTKCLRLNIGDSG